MTLELRENGGIRACGTFRFSASLPGETESIQDEFKISIEVPRKFPREIPTVFETGGRIPRSPGFHVNPEGSLCLGSPIRLLTIVFESPTILGFADRILVPFLFAVSRSLSDGRGFPFGELPHGAPGALIDYQNLFGLKTPSQARLVLRALSLRRRVANKRPCPCGCRVRLGRCRLRWKLNHLRKAASRSWFRRELQSASLVVRE
jgi:hypothetical protein